MVNISKTRNDSAKARCLSLNNSAVHSLEINEVSYACELIGIAMKLIQNQSKYRSSSSSLQNESSSKCYSFRWSNTSSLSTQILNSPDPNNYFLFKRGLFIFDNKNHKNSNNLNLSTDIIAAISYNAGLIFQLFAIKRNKISLLSKAGNFYRLSQAVLRKANERGIKSKLCFCFFFHVPLLNNLGQLCYDLVDYQSSAYYFDRIQKQLHQLIERSEVPVASQQRKTNHFTHTDLLKMLANTIVEIPTLAPAA